ncbi:hypothetical protein [Paenibacillus xerothermodurans]|uniref:Uncharacterized protein n=1 Tax=Paenibacillus xerothermodurans TaxID=1977292 RepID=A0A2W1N8C4_PAEXE|nr:hypothetical protein [Paenibacillus xerothermodurans]PZE19890.1 hypothetical protein CBW46_016340 [Paenibacillus xerothermodurans]
MLFVFILLSALGYFLFIGIASLLGVHYRTNSLEPVIFLLIVLTGIALNINYKIKTLQKETKAEK